MTRMTQYSDVLGKPGTGLHAYRLCNIAIVDVLLTVFVAYTIHCVFRVSFWWTLLSLFVIGIALHWFFGVPTTVNVALGL